VIADNRLAELAGWDRKLLNEGQVQCQPDANLSLQFGTGSGLIVRNSTRLGKQPLGVTFPVLAMHFLQIARL